MQRASYGDRHTITVMTKDKHLVFDFTSKVIDFFTVFPKEEDGNNESPISPEALVVLAEEELVAIDLTNPEWKMMALPYLVSLHASAVSIPKRRHEKSVVGDAKYKLFHIVGDLFSTRAQCPRRAVGGDRNGRQSTDRTPLLG